MSHELQYAIAHMAGPEGWWKRYSQEVFEQSAERLLALGMPEAEIIMFLDRLYKAVENCYS